MAIYDPGQANGQDVRAKGGKLNTYTTSNLT